MLLISDLLNESGMGQEEVNLTHRIIHGGKDPSRSSSLTISLADQLPSLTHVLSAFFTHF